MSDQEEELHQRWLIARREHLAKKESERRFKKTVASGLGAMISILTDVYQNYDHRAAMTDMKVPQEGTDPPEDDCCICLEALKAKPCLLFDGCGHWIHRDCERDRREKQKDDSCPLCRGTINIKKPDPAIVAVGKILSHVVQEPDVVSKIFSNAESNRDE